MYHAYYTIGTADMLPQVRTHCEEFFTIDSDAQHIDITSESYTLFSVEEARALVARAVLKLSGARTVIIIHAHSLSSEAQNTLLKTFEEPIANTHFVVVITARDMLIPTLRSRMQALVIGTEHTMSDTFLTLSKDERDKRIKKLHKDLKDEKTTMEEVRTLLTTLERELHAQGSGERAFELGEVLKAKHALLSRGVSPKILLEHINAIL